MGYRIEHVEGIGPTDAEKLAAAGIKTTTSLLKACGDRKGRQSVGEDTGISENHLLRWANLADLMRITGVGPRSSELLEAAGVVTVDELRSRSAASLAAGMKRVHAVTKITRTSPVPSIVQRWIDQAEELAPVITD